MKGESQTLTVLYTPENTTDDRTAIFTSSDPEAVSVDENGTVTAVGHGTAVIRASVGEAWAECIVRVIDLRVYDVEPPEEVPKIILLT